MSREITTSESQPKRKRNAAKKAKATSSKKTAKNAKAKPSSNPKDTKKERVLELLRRKEGATIADIAKATDWQNHSIRGFISGMLTKKMGLAVESVKDEGGERTYRISE